ncbi:MAG: hypothetical protein U0414_15310 [Polyangiaceae bacterium]
MRPLEGLPDIEKALLGAPPARVRAALDQALSEPSTDARRAASMLFAEGAFLLRNGSLEAAATKFDEAVAAFEPLGDAESTELARIEAHTARIRRGVRDLATRAREELAVLAESGATDRVKVAALVVRGTSERVAGEAALAHESFLAALERSARLPDLRTQALNSLGTLYVVTGALSAAVPNLERAAELCHARGDVVGEAIAMGQLGAAALGLGDLHTARRYLSRQEFLARSVDDAFGRARALVWLAEVALALGSPNDAIEVAARARTVAEEAKLSTWVAYSNRITGRALRERGDASTEPTERALATFRAQKLSLGEALCLWDLGVATEPPDLERTERALQLFASLGLIDRVSEVLLDLRRLGASKRGGAPHVDVLLAAVGLTGRRAESVEAELVHDDPVGLAHATGVRTCAKRNVARLALLATTAPGLVVLAVVGVPDPARLLEDRAFEGVILGSFGDAALIGWTSWTDRAAIVADRARVIALAPSARGVFARLTDARVDAPGHGGGLGARLLGVDTTSLLTAALAERGVAEPPEWNP